MTPEQARELRELPAATPPELASANDSPTRERRSEHWCVRFADRQTLELSLTEPVTGTWVRERYPDAVAVDPMLASTRAATQAEKAEFHALLAAILPGDAAGQREALSVALGDIDDALTCFRALAASAAPARSCSTCQHLRHPGTTLGCVERSDLPELYGLLHRLPDDRGTSCPAWREA